MNNFSLTRRPCPEDPRLELLHLSGNLDITVLDRITEAVDSLIQDCRFHLVVDMEGVTFISSPVVGSLMGCRRRLVQKGGNIVLVGLSSSLREKLNLMGANRIFRYYPDYKSVVMDFRWQNDAKPQCLALQLPTNSSYVPALRRLVASIVQQKGYGRKDTFRIETIVDELANNAIEHGDEQQRKFYIELFLDREKVEVVVRNTNKNMDEVAMSKVRDKFSNPEVDDNSIRGRGLALVKMLSSELKLEIDTAGTLVHVTKMREE